MMLFYYLKIVVIEMFSLFEANSLQLVENKLGEAGANPHMHQLNYTSIIRRFLI